jgi:hypothetical protein
LPCVPVGFYICEGSCPSSRLHRGGQALAKVVSGCTSFARAVSRWPSAPEEFSLWQRS